MIVYREQQEAVDSSWCIREIANSVRRLRRQRPAEHGEVVRLLIDVGEFETAVTDALSTEANLVSPVTSLLRATSLLAGHLFYWSWKDSAANVAMWAGRLESATEKVAAVSLPRTLQIRVSEGYAYYSLAPEA